MAPNVPPTLPPAVPAEMPSKMAPETPPILPPRDAPAGAPGRASPGAASPGAALPGDPAPAFQAIAARRDGAVLHLTLNRPESRNALSLAMVGELRAALAAAEASAAAGGGVRVIVLRGAGGHFCAGADLKDTAAARSRAAEQGQQALQDYNAEFGHLCGAYARSPLATVAVLEGAVMGGGFGLACAVDIALAGSTVAFRLPETSLGVVPAQIAPYLIERIGIAQARRLAISGVRVDGAGALALGLVHELHAADQLDAALARVLGEILQCAPGALAATKALLAQSRYQPPAAMVEPAARVFAQAALGAEGVEGVLAFLQKRKPAWSPQ